MIAVRESQSQVGAQPALLFQEERQIHVQGDERVEQAAE